MNDHDVADFSYNFGHDLGRGFVCFWSIIVDSIVPMTAQCGVYSAKHRLYFGTFAGFCSRAAWRGHKTGQFHLPTKYCAVCAAVRAAVGTVLCVPPGASDIANDNNLGSVSLFWAPLGTGKPRRLMQNILGGQKADAAD